MAEVAEVFPDAVLLNIIPIFTFMGANILRRDDDYSFYVIQQTLESVVPALIKRHLSDMERAKREMIPVIEVFADSLFHTPKHRRLRLFTILVSALGPQDFLASVTLILLSKSIHKSQDGSDLDSANMPAFCLSLFTYFPLTAEISSLYSMLKCLSTDKVTKEQLFPINLKQFMVKEIKLLKSMILEFIGSILESGTFMKQVKSSSNDETDQAFATFFGEALQLMVDVELSADAVKPVGKKTAQPVNLVLLTAFKALDVMVKVLAGFMSPFINDIVRYLLLSCHLQGDPGLVQQIESYRIELAGSISTKVSARTLLPAISTHLDLALKADDPQPILFLFDILSTALSSIDKDDLVQFHADLIKLFLKCFEYRQNMRDISEDKHITLVEAGVMSCFVDFVLLLNESYFKPLFFLVLDWAQVDSREENQSNRVVYNQLFLYQLMEALLTKLKSIFAPYFANVLDNIVHYLVQAKRRNEVDNRWLPAVSSLHKYFTYAKVSLTEARFNALVASLVDQLDMVSAYKSDYKAMVIGHLTPCLGELAVSAGREPMWKPLNKAVLNKSRDEHPLVRIAAIRTLQEFYVRLGEEFLVLLPETVPFLAELME
ncbi:HEAT repeat-containing protein 1, partial [Cladochytrium tenue]